MRTVAVHGNNGFARRWPACAEDLGLVVRRVDAFSPKLWDDLAGCDAFLWSLNHESRVDMEFGKNILWSLESHGLKVFPNHATAWHFDDKVAQHFHLSGLGIPMPSAWLFTDKTDALRFADHVQYPIVFKLKRGAGAMNVCLVRDNKHAKRLIRLMFSRGVRTQPVGETALRALGRGAGVSSSRASLLSRGRRAASRLLAKWLDADRDRGYVFFQEFIPGNTHDTRVTIIGQRAFTFERQNRQGDFRASGSGHVRYPEPNEVPLDMVGLAFAVCEKLKAQCLAFDFVRDISGKPLILEISFSFKAAVVEKCPGYFDSSLCWHPDSPPPEELMLRDLFG